MKFHVGPGVGFKSLEHKHFPHLEIRGICIIQVEAVVFSSSVKPSLHTYCI